MSPEPDPKDPPAQDPPKDPPPAPGADDDKGGIVSAIAEGFERGVGAVLDAIGLTDDDDPQGGDVPKDSKTPPPAPATRATGAAVEHQSEAFTREVMARVEAERARDAAIAAHGEKLEQLEKVTEQVPKKISRVARAVWGDV